MNPARIRLHCQIVIALVTFASCQQEPVRYEKDLSDLTWSIWIDSTASWEEDTLFLPPVALQKIKVNPPGKGWDYLENPGLQKTRLPATVEQYFWDNKVDTAWGSGDYSGVSWFTTTQYIPAELEGKLLFLDFESVRLRAEIYVNRELAGYDCIGNTPFRAEITGHVQFGSENQIAIRITDPGGNFYWEDYHLDRWGTQYIPPSHGFGGITGPVHLVATDPSFIEDIYIQNQPEINRIRILTTIQNLHRADQKGRLCYNLFAPGVKRDGKKIQLGSFDLKPGSNVIDTLVTISDYQPWTPDQPNLYSLEVTWSSENGDRDRVTKRFGLRWFEARSVEGATSFYLNNKRIFLTSAISWGFWPENGIFPTPELAEKQVRNLKILGLNMFNFHRAIGQPALFEQADQQGILVYEEPGGYRCPSEKIWFWKPEDDPSNHIDPGEAALAWQWRREKLYRMIKRDRSHPSLVIYNMGNEMLMDPDERHTHDMAGAHLLDPSRYITFSSHSFHPLFFPQYPGGDCPRDTATAKLFMKPFDHNFHYFGWWDNHHALGEGTYMDCYYNGSGDYNLYSDNREEIVFYGEEGAIHAPPRLDSIIPRLDHHAIGGWDSDYLRRTYAQVSDFLKRKGFDDAGVTLESLTTSFANNAYDYHARMIENCRIGNHVDAYVINGLEDPKRGFCSGILDVYRNIKGDAGLLSAPMEPLYLAIKPTNRLLGPGDQVECDIHIVNEEILQGRFLLEVNLLSGDDTLGQKNLEVTVSGGTSFGELLAEQLGFELKKGEAGRYLTLAATLRDNLKTVATGVEKLFQLPDQGLPPGCRVIYEGDGGAIQDALVEQGVELFSLKGPRGGITLMVVTDPPRGMTVKEILEWVETGNHLVVLEHAAQWAEILDQKGEVQFKGVIQNDTEWSAGGAFNRPHPIFRELPSGCVMGWEYQELTNHWRNRHSLQLEGETAIVGALGPEPHLAGTAMGEISMGYGTILLNTLDFESALQKDNSAGKMASTLLGNIVLHYSNHN
ncbi:MAG: glycoside hydrolase family 2 TIM barrel-domain containing protein [Bacteroidales bacterium]